MAQRLLLADLPVEVIATILKYVFKGVMVELERPSQLRRIEYIISVERDTICLGPRFID